MSKWRIWQLQVESRQHIVSTLVAFTRTGSCNISYNTHNISSLFNGVHQLTWSTAQMWAYADFGYNTTCRVLIYKFKTLTQCKISIRSHVSSLQPHKTISKFSTECYPDNSYYMIVPSQSSIKCQQCLIDQGIFVTKYVCFLFQVNLLQLS